MISRSGFFFISPQRVLQLALERLPFGTRRIASGTTTRMPCYPGSTSHVMGSIIDPCTILWTSPLPLGEKKIAFSFFFSPKAHVRVKFLKVFFFSLKFPSSLMIEPFFERVWVKQLEQEEVKKTKLVQLRNIFLSGSLITRLVLRLKGLVCYG